MPSAAVHHEIVDLPVLGKARYLPVIMTDSGPLAGAVRYLSKPRFDNSSASTRRSICRSIGLLFDYTLAVGYPDAVGDRKRFLSDFVLALASGTAVAAQDESGLNWTPMSWTQIRQIIGHVTAFGDFCCDEHEYSSLNPSVPATFHERIAALSRLDKKHSHSLLRHLKTSKAEVAAATATREVQSPRPPKVAATRKPAFPSEHFDRLLNQGFLRPGSRPEDPPWKRWNIRDMLICILQRHGGVRESEPFHLFAVDVKPDAADPSSAQVFLCHPQLSKITYRDSKTGRMVTESRTEFLRAIYGLQPRNLVVGKQRSGWKDLLLDEGAPNWRARVRWFPEEWGRVFMTLFQIYIKHVLPKDMDHPYLFVVLREGDNFGRPYTLAAYNQNLSAAVRRIGLEVSKAAGTTSHGLRHRYGQDLDKGDVPEKVIMLAMHHKSVQSQLVYTGPELGEVNAALNRAASVIAQRSAGVDGSDLQPIIEAVLAGNCRK